MGVSVPLDFTGVEARASVRAPEGDYVVKIKKVTQKPAKTSGNPMLVIDFEFRSGPKDIQGKTIRDRHVLTKESLWTLRNMLEAMGYKVPASKMKLDADKMLIGKSVGITVVDGEEYKGRIRSEVADYLPVSSVGNKVSGDDLDEEDEGDWEDDLMSDDEDEEEEVEESEEEADEEEDEEESEEEESEEDEEESSELSFSPDDVESADVAGLKAYVKEAEEAGWDLGLPKKAKKADVVAALLSLFEEDEEEEEDDDEMEDFDLDDV